MNDYMIVFADDNEWLHDSRYLDSSIDRVFGEIMHMIGSDHNGCSGYHEQ